MSQRSSLWLIVLSLLLLVAFAPDTASAQRPFRLGRRGFRVRPARIKARRDRFDKMLRQMDRNGDGRISRDEWRRRPQAFDQLDLDRDGFLSRSEVNQARRERGQQRRNKFAAMDRNQDGKITREEWTRKPKAFDKLDRNHDGVISMDELQRRQR